MLDVFFIRKITFPRGAQLWVLLNQQGLRFECLERGDSLGRRVAPLDRLLLQTQNGRSKYPALQNIEILSPASTSPAWLAFDAWLAEMIEVGLTHDDPHPELFELLSRIERQGLAPIVATWGQIAMQIGRILGVWAPPSLCQCTGTGKTRDARSFYYYCQTCVDQAPNKMLTLCGDMQVPLALLLDELECTFRNAFDRSLTSVNFIRQLGQRGLLAV